MRAYYMLFNNLTCFRNCAYNKSSSGSNCTEAMLLIGDDKEMLWKVLYSLRL